MDLMQIYSESLTAYRRLKTSEVNIGGLLIGNYHPVRIQTMTTTNTLDTRATVEQTIRCIEAGAELVRITAPSKKEAENLLNIRNALHKQGYHTPLVADIHFTPNAAEIAARIVEKVRINPGNYVDKKKFEFIEYGDSEYQWEIERIRERFLPLVRICKEYGTAMRIGTNHGSLSDRIMSRYGDTANGMVESAMEFLRIARDESYHNIVLSMKSSNPQVMVQAYRLLIQTMTAEFGSNYPLHLGVTEAGDGEDGRIKSAIGIGTLLEDGIGDTIRVSLTEDPEFEIPVCKDLVARYVNREQDHSTQSNPIELPYSPFSYTRRPTREAANIGGKNVPVVVADFGEQEDLSTSDLNSAGYTYDPVTDKWKIQDAAADLLYCGSKLPSFELPGTLRPVIDHASWLRLPDKSGVIPLLSVQDIDLVRGQNYPCIVKVDGAGDISDELTQTLRGLPQSVLLLSSSSENEMQSLRSAIATIWANGLENPVIIRVHSNESSIDRQLIHFSSTAGALLLDGMGDGVWLSANSRTGTTEKVSGRTYLHNENQKQFLNNTSFSILQATRTRISRTEYISCPSCGRTLFDLQETTSRIRAVTNHLKGVKIAIMGCIVNGPGEMADADFGYVGSGPGKITLYKGKEVVKRSVNSEVAVEELIMLLKESGAWIDPVTVDALPVIADR
jgi:(E)-4-hydroxy-3-methylbut-2-enyl-diphosphate synthase